MRVSFAAEHRHDLFDINTHLYEMPQVPRKYWLLQLFY
jgi:hypothetical protein